MFCFEGFPGKRELDLENERLAHTGIVGGVADHLEIGLQFSFVVELPLEVHAWQIGRKGYHHAVD